MPVNLEQNDPDDVVEVYTKAEVDTLLANITAGAAPADAARVLVWTGSWPDRPKDNRPTIFVGGNEPNDPDIRDGDIWVK